MGSVSLLKVSSKSNPNAVAGAIAGIVREDGTVDIQVIGAGALNQAIKAIAIARGFVISSGIDLICTPCFQDIVINGEDRTAIRLKIEDRNGIVRLDLPHLQVTEQPLTGTVAEL